jgi:hypothetical protein
MKNNNIQKMVTDHDSMKNWHESMAKAAAESMQDHIKAAAWHNSQTDLLKSMMEEIPLDPDKKVTNIPEFGSAQPPTSGAGYASPAKEVPLDAQIVKKSDLIEILKDHVSEYGSFDMSVEDIADVILGLK